MPKPVFFITFHYYHFSENSFLSCKSSALKDLCYRLVQSNNVLLTIPIYHSYLNKVLAIKLGFSYFIHCKSIQSTLNSNGNNCRHLDREVTQWQSCTWTSLTLIFKTKFWENIFDFPMMMQPLETSISGSAQWAIWGVQVGFLPAV